MLPEPIDGLNMFFTLLFKSFRMCKGIKVDFPELMDKNTDFFLRLLNSYEL